MTLDDRLARAAEAKGCDHPPTVCREWVQDAIREAVRECAKVAETLPCETAEKRRVTLTVRDAILALTSERPRA